MAKPVWSISLCDANPSPRRHLNGLVGRAAVLAENAPLERLAAAVTGDCEAVLPLPQVLDELFKAIRILKSQLGDRGKGVCVCGKQGEGVPFQQI